MRLTQIDLIRQVRNARQFTTIGGTIAVQFTECPKCGAFPGMLCKSRDNEETNAVHAARSNVAADQLAQPLIRRRDVKTS